MMFSTELREPFLDHRLVEFGFALPAEMKIRNGQRKWLARRVAEKYMPSNVSHAPKRPLQIPQREWLAEEHKPWVLSLLHNHAYVLYHWMSPSDVVKTYEQYCTQKPENSFHIWQLVNAVLLRK